MAKIVSNKLKIIQYIHCGLCANEYISSPEIKSKMSPRDYAQLEFGWTKDGLQVWCKRHECNIIHLDFGGKKLNANTTRVMTGKEKKELIKLK